MFEMIFLDKILTIVELTNGSHIFSWSGYSFYLTRYLFFPRCFWLARIASTSYSKFPSSNRMPGGSGDSLSNVSLSKGLNKLT